MFQLKAKESVSEGIKRNVTRELEKIIASLGTKRKSLRGDNSEAEVAHEARKAFKKLRAAVRLIREDLGDEVYHEENCYFRDTARPLTSIRDAQMLVETLDKIRGQFATQINKSSVAKMQDTLVKNQQEVAHRVVDGEKAFINVKNAASLALARVSDWKIDRTGWEALEAGLRRVYRTGHRALRLAEDNPSVANLHEWRKQVKYLWHTLQLIEPAWTDHEKDLGDQFHRLSRILGEDHDLAVLRETLAADPLAYGGHALLKDLFTLIDRNRKELEREAFALGRPLYKDLPRVFTEKIESYWKAWAGVRTPEKTRIPIRAQPARLGQ